MNNLTSLGLKPSKTIIFTNRPKNNFNTIHIYKNKNHSLSKQQKLFNTIIPVRPFTRFIKPKISNNERKKSAIKLKLEKDKEEDENKEKNEKNEINLNFDYNKYLLKSVVLKVPNLKSGNSDVFKTNLLDREICQVSNSTLESINYYKEKSIKIILHFQ